MSGKLLDGKALAQVIQAEISEGIADLFAKKRQRPGLAAVLVGENPASQIYVRNKQKACSKVGVQTWLHELPKDCSQERLLRIIDELNADPRVDGILVQLPLPRQINEAAIINAVSPWKDVDGFHPENYGLLAAGLPRFVPCTPLGIQQLLIRNHIPVDGAHAVVVGRSNIVGKPMALLLLQKGPGGNATVTVCHSRSQNMGDITRQADIVIVAIGQAHFLKADMIRDGAAVIDVGMNRLADGKLAGDVDFDAVSKKASFITPVPGGVGPMTITMLLSNTLQSARWRVERS